MLFKRVNGKSQFRMHMSDFDAKQYWETRLTEKWGLHGVGYAGLGKYYNAWLYRVRTRVFLRHIRPLVSDWSKSDVLDIGSGTGFYVDLWKSLAVNSVTATDITTVAVDQLQEKFPSVECHQLDIGNGLPELFCNRQYHVISAFDVLFHIVEDDRYQRAFENIFQMLQPGGIFVFSENFIHGDIIREQSQVCRSLNDIEAVLKKIGFKVKLRAPMFAFMNYPVDSNSAFLKTTWKLMTRPARIFKLLGFPLGALLYPFELILTSYLNESPSTELMVSEK